MDTSRKRGYWSREPGYWRDQTRQVGKAIALALAIFIPFYACVRLVSRWESKLPRLLGLLAALLLEVWNWLASFTRLEWIAIIGIWLVLRSLRRISRQIDAVLEFAASHDSPIPGDDAVTNG